MTFDGFFTRAITKELSEQLIGGRISKIYQPFERELQLVIRNQRKNLRLNASIHPTYYNIGLTEERPSNPTHAPMFCMLMRKHLENAIVLNIQQIDNDRIIQFELSGLDELGDQQNYHLYFELMGRHSNILLVNPAKNTIIDCIKHVAPSLNTYRGLQPGAMYQMPPKNEQQVDLFKLDNLSTWSQNNLETISSGQASQIIEGLGKLGAQQLAYAIQVEGLTAEAALLKLMDGTQHPEPILFDENSKLSFYYTPLSSIKGTATPYPSLSKLVEEFYQQKVHTDRIKQLSGDLIQKLEHIIQRNEVKIAKLAKDRQVAMAADLFKVKGELLKAYSYQIEKGQTEAILDNFYDDNQPLKIELEPRLSAIENSQKYFRKYTKYRDSLKYIDEQTQLAQEENDYLEGILVQIQQANIEDIEDIKEELMLEGYVAQRKQNIKKRSKSTSKPRRYRSEDGVMIYVGRNNHQNDELSLKIASKNHWWLHAKDIPGSHVIIESDKPSDETITLAGELAAYFSKFSDSASIPVDVLQVKQLRKPNGAKPGYVIYEGQRTIFVTPNPDKLATYLVD